MKYVFNKLTLASVIISICNLYLVIAQTPLDFSEKNWPQICQTGLRQTPIDMPSNYTYNTNEYISIISSDYSMINSAGLTINEKKTNFYIQNITNAGPLMIKKNGITYQYDLIDIHFHINSEHTIKGIPYDIEMHLVHKKNVAYLSTTGVINDPDLVNSLLVIGIMYRGDVTQENLSFAKFDFAKLGPISNLNVNGFASPSKSFYHYIGGLTTPNCDEIVNWIVMDAVESISPAQLLAAKAFISKVYPAGNVRSVKLLNGRTIYYKPATAVQPLVNVKTAGAYVFLDKLIYVFVVFLITLF